MFLMVIGINKATQTNLLRIKIQIHQQDLTLRDPEFVFSLRLSSYLSFGGLPVHKLSLAIFSRMLPLV